MNNGNNKELIASNKNIDQNILKQIESLEQKLPPEASPTKGANYGISHPFSGQIFNQNSKK
jgi:hypothetical protein